MPRQEKNTETKIETKFRQDRIGYYRLGQDRKEQDRKGKKRKR